MVKTLATLAVSMTAGGVLLAWMEPRPAEVVAARDGYGLGPFQVAARQAIGAAHEIEPGRWSAVEVVALAEVSPGSRRTLVATAPPDFELLAKKFASVPSPAFKGDRGRKLSQYGQGLTIICSDQCPYTAKAINEITATAEEQYHIKPAIMELKNYQEAQDAPSPFAIFGIVYKGKLVADHPISNSRFKNIMNKEAG